MDIKNTLRKYENFIVNGLVELDELISPENEAKKRIFGDQNVRIGYYVSMGTYIFGRSGRVFEIERIERNYNFLKEKVEAFRTEAPKVCPVCQYPQGYYMLYSESLFE